MAEIKICQISCVGQIGRTSGLADVLWQQRNRLRRIFKRRWCYGISILSKSRSKALTAGDRVIQKSTAQNLCPGDIVRVRCEKEIRSTLDHWNQLRGCSFMQEMWPYCGTTQKVFKRIEKFLDERDYLMKKCKGIVILENVFCQGTKDFGDCDRTCFFFWREEWLEKV